MGNIRTFIYDYFMKRSPNIYSPNDAMPVLCLSPGGGGLSPGGGVHGVVGAGDSPRSDPALLDDDDDDDSHRLSASSPPSPPVGRVPMMAAMEKADAREDMDGGAGRRLTAGGRRGGPGRGRPPVRFSGPGGDGDGTGRPGGDRTGDGERAGEGLREGRAGRPGERGASARSSESDIGASILSSSQGETSSLL